MQKDLQNPCHNTDLVAAKHAAFLRAEHTGPKVMGSPRLHRR